VASLPNPCFWLQVLLNPFDDIIPRQQIVNEKEKSKKSKVKGKK